MDEGTQITVEDVRQFNAKILQLVDLADLLPILRAKDVLSEEILQKVSSSKHHTQFERSNFLLNYLYQQGQAAIDAFVESLRESKSANHAQILRLLEGDLLEAQPRSPLFSILEKHLDAIIANINLVSFLKSLLSIQAIPVNTFLDLQNTDRSLKETLEKLFPVLEKQGNRGFINFLSCLQKDTPNPGHEKLSELLFVEVKRFFKEHPQRDRVSQSDRIEILQLERREKVIGQEIHQRMVRHRDTLAAQINVPAVLPSLLKTQVITRQDMDYLSKLEPGNQGSKLLDLLLGKELSMVIKFAECLKESPDNREAGELLLPSPQGASSVAKRPDQVLEKYDKLAVFVYADHYLSPNGLPTSLEPQAFDQPVRDHRETLKRQLEGMDFHVVTLETSVDADDYNSETAKELSKFLNGKFKEEIAKHCNEGAVVIVFLSGIQFPSKNDKSEFNGAVLRSNASKYGRLPSDSIECSDLTQWVGFLPGAHVTILVDTDPSHVVAYDKTQQVTKVEIMTDPWSSLTSFDSSTVVIYLQPDPDAMAVSRGSQQLGPLGMLTEVFTKAMVSCVLKSKEPVSHRSLFEAISFYWYSCEDGRMHKLFKPAMVGDVDRQFLGTTVIPYQQVFRADLQRTEKDKGFSNEIKLPTGTMAGLIQGDHLEMFHPLRPGVRVKGQVTESYQLHSKAVVDKEEWPRLHDVLLEVYKDRGLGGDASVEFLFVRKKFPLHQRLAVYPRELGRGETNTLKTYIKDRSNLLSYVPQEKEAMVVVHVEDQLFVLEDQAEDVKCPMKTRSIERVKSLLEIIAWFKYVKSLKSKSKHPFQYECSLTAARPLLSPADPICRNFGIFYSSFVGVNPASLGFEAILNFDEPPQFWAPARDDPNPFLRVQFKKNQLITAIELRGDNSYPKFVCEVNMQHKKIISEGIITPDNKSLSLSEDERVQYVILKADVESREVEFSVTMSIKVKKPGTKKSIYVDQVGVFEPWPIPQHWRFIPNYDQRAIINLAPANHQLTWSGTGGGRLALNLLKLPVHFDKIEVLDQKNVKQLSISLESEDYALQVPVSSPYPKRVTFPRPIVASTVVVRPTKLGDHRVFSPPLSVMPNAGQIRLQLQLHGNAWGREPLVVDEQDLINFQFNSLMLKQLYFYILCLEETGCISLLNEGKEEAPVVIPQRDGQPAYYPAERKFLQAVIPKDYTPKRSYMQDEYRVWVSSTRLYVEPFIQAGISSRPTPICYNVCTQGHKTRQVVDDEWSDEHYSVRIKKS